MAKLTREELIRLNRQLAAQGERICPACYVRQPLTTDYWYQTTGQRGRRAGRTTWVPRCRRCHSATQAEVSRRRNRAPEVRARKTLTARNWRAQNPDKSSAASQRYRRNRRARLIARALGKDV